MNQPYTAQEIAKRYETPMTDTEAAVFNLHTGESLLFGISGKMGAGKDTIAHELLTVLQKQEKIVKTVSFGTALKHEVTTVLQDIVDGMGVLKFSEKHAVSVDNAERVIDIVASHDPDQTSGKTGFDKTPAVRALLQTWGTDIRRQQDPLYWVKKAANTVASTLQHRNTAVIVVDCRFVNEISMPNDFGGTTIRLEISPEVQKQRLLSRDNKLPSSSAILHSSETDLDTYDSFDFYLNTDNKTPSELVQKLMTHF